MILKVCLISLLILSISAVAPNTRYKTDSANRSKLPAGSNEVVFIGSATVDFWSNFPVLHGVNRGIAGETTTQTLARFQQDVIALRPKVVVIYLGSNDIVKDINNPNVYTIFGDNVKSMHTLAKQHNIKVVQMSVHPACGNQKVQRPTNVIVQMNQFLRQLCESQTTCFYADTYSSLVDQLGDLNIALTKDCVNISPQGYEIINSVVERAIQTLDRTVLPIHHNQVVLPTTPSAVPTIIHPQGSNAPINIPTVNPTAPILKLPPLPNNIPTLPPLPSVPTVTPHVGNLGKYQADSLSRSRLPVGSNDVVFIGSSTVERWNPFPRVRNAVNRGIVGEVTSQILSRFQQDVIALRPRVVVLYLGATELSGLVNSDKIIRQYENDVRAMHKLATANKIRIVQVNLNPACGDKKAQRPLALITRINKFLKQQCANEATCVYANVYSATADRAGEFKRSLTNDCVNPNRKGYEETNSIVNEAVRQVLNLKLTRRRDGSIVRDAIEVAAN